MKEKLYKIEITYATYMGVAIDGTEDNPHTGIKAITIKEVKTNEKSF